MCLLIWTVFLGERCGPSFSHIISVARIQIKCSTNWSVNRPTNGFNEEVHC